MNEKLKYTPSIMEEIRKKDPRLQTMVQQWERAFGGQVQVKKDKDGNLIVVKKT
jgi:hypothetical protein